MADLATCYFCGGVEDEIVEHPVVPDELEVPAEFQQTVAVCAECAEKFDRAIAPLVGLLREAESVPDVEPTGGRSAGEGAADDGAERVDDEGSSESTRREAGGVEREVERPEESREGTAMEGTTSEDEETTNGEPAGRVELPDASRDVLRLLQNREFPVDRGEIETVATSAYELGLQESSEAIDALIERGVLVERDGRLDRPD